MYYYPQYPLQAPLQPQIDALNFGRGNIPGTPQNGVTTTQNSIAGLSVSSRPVSNREEAVGTPADFSGSLMVFPDLAHGRVYLKRWNMQTGAADFLDFVLDAQQSEQNTEQPTKSEPKWALDDDVQVLRQEIQRLHEELDSMKAVPAKKGAKKDDSTE